MGRFHRLLRQKILERKLPHQRSRSARRCGSRFCVRMGRRSSGRRGPRRSSNFPWSRRMPRIRSWQSGGTWPSIQSGGKPHRNCTIGGRFLTCRSCALEVSRFPLGGRPTERRGCVGRGCDRDSKGPRQGGNPTVTESFLAAPSPSWHASRSPGRTARSSTGSKPHRHVAGPRLPGPPFYQRISSSAACFAPAATVFLVNGSRFEKS
jgi:hypothetical protein